DQHPEAIRPDEVDGEVLKQHEHKCADEGTDRPVHATNDGDDQDVDHRVDADDAGRYKAVVPGEQYASDSCHDTRNGVARDPMPNDVVAECRRATGIVTDRLKRKSE